MGRLDFLFFSGCFATAPSDFPSSEAESCLFVLCRVFAGDEAEGHRQGRRTAAVRGGRVRRTAGPSCPGTQAEQRP